MSTIKNMINLNQNFRNKNFDKINNFINNLKSYTKNDQRIIHNTILNILNKKIVSEEEITILNSIITKLSNNPDSLKMSTLIFLIDEIYSDIFQRDNDLQSLKKSLRNIPNNIIKLLLDIFEKANNSFTINNSKLNKEKYYESLEDKAIAHIIGYFRFDDNEPIMVLFYGREEKDGSKFKSFLDSIPLKDISQYYTELSKNNITNKERFSLIKSVSGKSPKIERDGDKYKYIIKNKNSEQDNPIIYTDLEKKGNNDFKLINPLSNVKKNNNQNTSKNKKSEKDNLIIHTDLEKKDNDFKLINPLSNVKKNNNQNTSKNKKSEQDNIIKSINLLNSSSKIKAINYISKNSDQDNTITMKSLNKSNVKKNNQNTSKINDKNKRSENTSLVNSNKLQNNNSKNKSSVNIDEKMKLSESS